MLVCPGLEVAKRITTIDEPALINQKFADFSDNFIRRSAKGYEGKSPGMTNMHGNAIFVAGSQGSATMRERLDYLTT